MPKLYPLRTQLNTGAPTDGDDCSPVTIINAIKWASNNQINIKQSDVARWVKKIRVWANRPRGGFFLMRDTFAVYEHPEFKAEFTKRGLKPPVATYHDRANWDVLVRRAKAGHFVHLAVNYGTLRAGHAPTGSSSFSGGHSLALLHAPKVSAHRHRLIVWDGDPLFDGRRQGIPDGWVGAPLVEFKRAAGNWGKPLADYGNCYMITLKKGV